MTNETSKPKDQRPTDAQLFAAGRGSRSVMLKDVAAALLVRWGDVPVIGMDAAWLELVVGALRDNGFQVGEASVEAVVRAWRRAVLDELAAAHLAAAERGGRTHVIN